MKKKLLTILLIVFAISTCLFTLTACGHTHTYTSQVIEPTCSEQGYTKHTCECGDTYNDTYVNALEHNYATPTYVWQDNKCTATRICSRDNNHIETESVIGIYVKDSDATCTTAETGHYEATFINLAFETQSTTANSYINGEELGHNYATPTYVWEDNKCTATRICGKDNNHIETESVIGIYVKDTDATCTTAEKGHYKATFTNPAFIMQETAKNSVTIGEPVHIWEYGNCSECGETQLEMKLSSDNQYYIVAGIGSFTDKELIIPTSYNNLPVKTIGSFAFTNCNSLENIAIPDSITSIGSSALKGCNSLINITLPFIGASKSETGFRSVFGYIFGYTTSDSETKIDDTTYQCYETYGGYYHYYIPSTIKSVNITNTTFIANYVFRNCNNITNITLSNNITKIGNEAFSGCNKLTSITIPDNVISIGDYAFSNCSSLENITVGKNVTTIGHYAFYGCRNLTKVNYKGTIDTWAQIKFNSSTSANYEANPTYYANDLYINNILVTEAIFTNTTEISDYAFYMCNSLTSVIIGNNITSIGEYAFGLCVNLKNIELPNSVKNISDYSFFCCNSLIYIRIPNSVTNIGAYAFNSCTSLISVDLPNTITNISACSFAGCSKLVNINFKGTTEQWKNITKVSNWLKDTKVEIITCTNGTVSI